MRIYTDIDNLPAFNNAVVTIGSFDGVHIGHQKIIQQINNLAASINGESVLITFYPHPRLVLGSDVNDLRLINTLEEKAQLLEQYGVDVLVVVPFSKAFASQHPDSYIEDFLVAKLNPKIIAIGYDHKFGKNREGNISYLQRFETKHGFKVIEISRQEVADIAVSSTKIRNAIQQGDVNKAQKLLGHSFVLTGKVVYGEQIGSKIGFPTANIKVDDPHKLIPPEGIYAVLVSHESVQYGGMLYIGNRPTIDNNLRQTIEVNIFDFDKDIYGDQIQVAFIEYLRGDEKYSTLDALKRQLAQDKTAALHSLEKIQWKTQN